MKTLSKVGTLILVFVICFLFIIFYLWSRGPTYGTGEFSELSVNLTDNNENDFVDIKFVSAGTGSYEIPVPFLLSELEIQVRLENNQKIFEMQLPPENISPGENVRVFFDTDVIEVGKFYRISFEYLPTGGILYEYTVECG